MFHCVSGCSYFNQLPNGKPTAVPYIYIYTKTKASCRMVSTSSNKTLAAWWCDKTGLQPSGAPKEAKTGIFKREGVSAKRHTRMVERRAACSQTWDDSSWYHGWHGGWSNGFWNDGGASSSAQAPSRPLESWTTARNARDKRR